MQSPHLLSQCYILDVKDYETLSVNLKAAFMQQFSHYTDFRKWKDIKMTAFVEKARGSDTAYSSVPLEERPGSLQASGKS
jgi:hypothetical protein